MRINNSTIQTTLQPLKTDHQKGEPALDKSAIDQQNGDRLTLSEEGKNAQKIDKLADEIDQKLIQKLSPDQRKMLDGLTEQLDRLESSKNNNLEALKQGNALHESIHSILESGYEKLNKQDKKQVDEKMNQIDQLSLKGLNISEGKGQDKAQLNSETEKAASASNLLQALTTAELRKLPASQLKTLNAQQLNKLTISQLNSLDLPQLKKLSETNQQKLSDSQQAKLS